MSADDWVSGWTLLGLGLGLTLLMAVIDRWGR